MPWTEQPKVIALRRRSRIVDVIIETLDGFRRHLTGRNAAVLTYYGFLTLFPLFLAASTVLGFVLESKPEWREDLVGSAVDSVPFIGSSLAEGTITGSWWALIIGLGAATWGSMRAFIGLQSTYDDTWEVGVDDRANAVKQRGRAIIGLCVIGGSQIANVALAALADGASIPGFSRVLLVLGGLAINFGVVSTMYRYLTSASVTWADVWPGSLFTGLVYTAFQFVGTGLTRRLLEGASTYGEFAGVLALLSWLSLHAIVNLFGAELNSALHRLRKPTDDASSVAASPASADSPAADV